MNRIDSKSKLNLKDWAIEDRPREKFIHKGISSLSDAELVAILIGSGNKKETAVELSKRILASFGNNLNELGKKSIADLEKFEGIGEAKAISIIAALELGKRRKLSGVPEKQKIGSSNDVFEIFQPILGDLATEEFWVLLLSQANKIIKKQRISQGGLTGTVVDIREILRLALENKAVGMIICHNHPSGNINPSEEDIRLTVKLKEASSFMDIKLLDHLIITDAGFYSMADNSRF